MPEISIIVPVYDVAPYLRKCMDSLVSQTFQNIEIICIDDGSTDDSPGILAGYASVDKRVKVLTQPNRGQATARNAGLAVATAPFIMFCDSDDWYASAMCEKMYAAIQQGGADMVMCGSQEVADGGETLMVGTYLDLPAEGEVDVDDDILMRCDVCPWNKIYRRSTLERGQIRFPDGYYFEDAYFFAVYTAYVQRIAFVPEKLYYYRRRAGSTTDRAFRRHRAGSIGRRVTDDCEVIANRIWEYHAERGLVAQRLPYLVHRWLEICASVLYGCETAEECADKEDALIAFAEEHITPCEGLPTAAKARLDLLKAHRWVGVHKHAGGHVVSKCRDKGTPDECKLKIKYYWKGILFWVRVNRSISTAYHNS